MPLGGVADRAPADPAAQECHGSGGGGGGGQTYRILKYVVPSSVTRKYCGSLLLDPGVTPLIIVEGRHISENARDPRPVPYATGASVALNSHLSYI